MLNLRNYIGEIDIYPFNFAPLNWNACDGTLLPIQQYTALFSLIGTYYGGNGTTNFQLPDLRSRVIVGTGQGLGLSNYVPGETGGTENTSILINNLPQHNHTIVFGAP